MQFASLSIGLGRREIISHYGLPLGAIHSSRIAYAMRGKKGGVVSILVFRLFFGRVIGVSMHIV